MSEYFYGPLENDESVSRKFLSFDSTKRSLLHRIFLPKEKDLKVKTSRYVIIYFLVVLISWVLPLIIVIGSQETLFQPKGSFVLPYLRDYNMVMGCLISLPFLLILHLKERNLIPKTLFELCDQGVISIDSKNADELIDKWTKKFARINLWGLFIGIIVVIIVAIFNRMMLLDLHGAAWQTVNTPTDRLYVLGWLFIGFQVAPIFFIMVQIVIREYYFVALFFDLSKAGDLNIQPLHPDRIGGLKPIANVGIHYQLGVAMVGINIGTLIVTINIVGTNAILYSILAVLFYIIVAPFAFVAPLIPFRPHMVKAKRDYLRRIANRFSAELEPTLSQIDQGLVKTDELDKLQKLSEFHKTISQFPEWPFDIATIRKFVAVFVSPLISLLISWLFEKVVGSV